VERHRARLTAFHLLQNNDRNEAQRKEAAPTF
jgi:hypothetical protein